MDLERLICIDIGSSYTKVAIRDGWDSPASLVRDAEDRSESSFCIPSAVARTTKGKDQWLVGSNALALKRGEGVEVYDNWKSQLFCDKKSAIDLEAVVAKFFSGLCEHLQQRGLNQVIAKHPCRICIPKLKGCGAVKARLKALAEAAGFTLEAQRPFVYEPESNVYGVLTRGRNATWQRRSWERDPRYADMFDFKNDGLLSRLRKVGLRLGSMKYSILVVDIGSFTTDVGVVVFKMVDGTIDDFEKPEVLQQSVPIGVRQLDQRILVRLSTVVQEAIAARPLREWEQNKLRLYDGQQAAVIRPGGGRIVIGTEADVRIIEDAIHEFANEVVVAVGRFCGKIEDPINRVVLTGGGAMISRLRTNVINAIEEQGACEVCDLLDPDEPKKSLVEKFTSVGWQHDMKEVEQRQKENRDLVRGASAIGGCSVFVDLPLSQHDAMQILPESEAAGDEILQEQRVVVPRNQDDNASDRRNSEPSNEKDVQSPGKEDLLTIVQEMRDELRALRRDVRKLRQIVLNCQTEK